jgi:hypothetical protein
VPSTTQFWQNRITSLDLRIAAYEAAMLAFAANGGQKEYRYDTGQTSIRVERSEPNVMQAVIDAMLSQREVYCKRIGQGDGTNYARGCW